MTNASIPPSMPHALVTGGGRGIGAAIAEALVNAGYRVSITGRDAARLGAQSAHLGEACRAFAMDVSQRDSVQACMAQAREAFGPVQVLINNAGQAESAPFQKTTEEAFDRMIGVNLKGVFHCIHAVLPDMLAAQSGRIVNIASTAGLRGYSYVSAYVAAKHGVVGLTRALALELAQKGITVNAVCPGYTDTDIVADAVAHIVAKTGRTPEDARAKLARGNPQGRLVQPAEVANAVLWLLGAEASAITGQSIAVAGGEIM